VQKENEIHQPEVVTGEIRAYRPALKKLGVIEEEDNAIELRNFKTFNPA